MAAAPPPAANLALPARGHVRLTARVPLPGRPRPALRQQHQLDPGGLGLLRQGGQPAREDAPEGLGYPALRESDLGGDLALAPALESQFQEAFRLRVRSGHVHVIVAAIGYRM